MIKKLREKLQALLKPDGPMKIATPERIDYVFTLLYGNLRIGTLQLEEGEWTFRYSEAFKAQDEIKPITEFPRLEKVYKSKDLFPFFVHRIPSLSQPKVQKTISRENIELDEASLLKRFGESSISNPFRLQVAPLA